MKTTVLFFVAAILAACSSGGTSASAAADRRRAGPAVREAAFRHLFADNASGLKDQAAAYYIRWPEADPDAAFLARFAGHEPPVRPASRCTADKERGVIDRDTGLQGLLFTIESIEWVSDDEAMVQAKYYEAGLSAGGYRLVVERDGKGWRVTGSSLLWIA